MSNFLRRPSSGVAASRTKSVRISESLFLDNYLELKISWFPLDRIKSNFCQRQSAAKPSSTTARSAAKPTSRPSSPLSSVPSMTFKKIDVQMGGAGSDDDMRVRICDASKCCTTKKLSHTFGSEWVAKKKETWDGSDMGNCSGRSKIIL